MKSRRPELVAAAAFVVLNLLAPLVIGELYPFTISPMFRDQPSQYCTYRVAKPNGEPVESLADFGLHLVYDGNPPGLGMGIQARPTLHEFGMVGGEAEVRRHVEEVLRQRGDLPFVDVTQTVVCREGNQVCPHEVTWRIERPGGLGGAREGKGK